MNRQNKNQKKPLRIAIIAAFVLALAAITLLVLAPRNNSNSADAVIPIDTISEEATVMEEVTVSEDSIIMEKGRRKDGYEKERERFDKVLDEASDEELFLVLKYAIANHYVPNRDVDPFFDLYVMVGCWQRSLKIYDKLLGRKDLLQQIYPDLEVLDEYVKWGWQTGQPYPDTIVSQAIIQHSQKDGGRSVDSLMDTRPLESSLKYKYFGTPLLRY